MTEIANIPRPPYFAVIFTSVRTAEDREGYDKTASRMIELAATMPGFLGIESVLDKTGITISYWEDRQSIQNWKLHSEHLAAQINGKNQWYQSYQVRICRVERDYKFNKRITEI